MSWKVTVRLASKVGREKFEDLEEALGFARETVDRVRREGRLGTISGFRDYTPDQRVQARVEISGKGLMRGPEAGIDVLGDGSLVPYAGAVRKRPLDAHSLDEAVERLREALSS